jgi:steroid delta-isomerase
MLFPLARKWEWTWTRSGQSTRSRHNCCGSRQCPSLAPGAVWFDPVGQPPHVGHAGVGEFYDQARSLADRIEMKLNDVIVCGTEAAMVLEIHAFMGDGGMVMDCVETLAVDDNGKISGMKAFWDMSRARPKSS